MSELDELEAKAQRATEAEAQRRHKALTKQARTRTKASARQQRRARDDGFAPVSAWAELQGMVVLSAACLLPLTLIVGLEGGWGVGLWMGAVWTLWAAVFGGLLLVRTGWQSRLGYQLQGFDRILGRWPEDDDRAPLLVFEVEVSFDEAANEEHRRAVTAALALLVVQGNLEISRDKDYAKCEPWKATERGARGGGSRGFYRGGLFRRWLCGPMKTAARLGGVACVRFKASYTGGGFSVDSGTF